MGADRAAAFFDLDRTLLGGASGPLLNEALVAAGLMPDRHIPGQHVMFRIYEVLGETLIGMAAARRFASMATGWNRAAVQEAAGKAAESLADHVLPYAIPLIEEHQRAGRPVVLATTTPYDLVCALAERLGFDDVIATKYATDDEGSYTGRIVDEFVWFTGKLSAIRRWAREHDVDLRQSWAYSDSFYDAPMLSAVGHPTAVNPDPRLRVLATVRRWPTRWLDVPPGVPKFAGLEPLDVVRALTRPELIPYARFDIGGVERIPGRGPAIVVANHRSYFDTVAIGMTVMRSGRPVRFLGKKEVFDAPVVGQLARAMGGIRVDRGSGSDEPLRAAADALEAGEVIALMPQGTIPRGELFFEPTLKGRPGAARLAAMTRAPVIPIGVWGTEKVWPRRARVPNVINVTSPPTVRTRVGAPVALTYDDVDADTERIMQAIVSLLPDEARTRRTPTPEEIALATPAS
jgi:putative phosphoserine phosphatase/1-acylglycerol-3-phosphate O-acyltransferase